MSERRTRIINGIVGFERFLREYWLDMLSIGLTLLGVALSILEFAGVIDL